MKNNIKKAFNLYLKTLYGNKRISGKEEYQLKICFYSAILWLELALIDIADDDEKAIKFLDDISKESYGFFEQLP